MTLVQANIRKIGDTSALCAKKISLKILLQVNLRLRACLAMCLKYGIFQPKRAYRARAYKQRKVYSIKEITPLSILLLLNRPSLTDGFGPS